MSNLPKAFLLLPSLFLANPVHAFKGTATTITDTKKTDSDAAAVPPKEVEVTAVKQPSDATTTATDETEESTLRGSSSLTQSGRQSGGTTKTDNTTSFAPATNRETEQDRAEVDRLAGAGDTAAAREYAVEALKRSPKDPALLSFVKLTAPSRTGVDNKVVNKRADELAAGMREDEGAGDAGESAILASPISFGALTGGASRGPAAVPGGLTPAPDIRGNAILRDASGKIAIKDYAGAESVLTRRLEEIPMDGSALRLRALTRRFLGKYAGSAEDAKRALELNQRDSRSLHLLSRNLTDLGRPREGLAEADRALTIDNKDAHAYVARAVAHSALGHATEELADLARAATLDAQFDSLYQDTLAARGAGTKSRRYWPVWLGAVGTALLFFSFAIFRKRGDSSVRLALRKDDHEGLLLPRPDAVPKGFKVVRVLGQGGMGVVYEAVDLGLQRTVAMKKLRPEVADNPRERGRFLKEARTVAALKHPNIVEIHTIHEDAEGLFLVFERVPGESMHERLGKGPMNAVDAATFLRQIASALDYAHAQGVVHQDLKPANVMIHGNLAKVMDFGIARRVQETLSTMSKIEVAGTPAYMSPEQELGVVSPSADVFALGACAYESLTGVLPYPTAGMMMKAQKMYRKPSEAAPGLKPGVDEAIARALEPRPEDRWPSASSFVDALVRAL